MEIIREGVRVQHFFRPYRGSFKGKACDSDIPPPVVINNSATCARFSQFISETIIQWVTAGVIAVWGPVDLVASPHLVLPFTVEPAKPRLCHYERYFNLWIRDLPFKLDHLCVSFPTTSRRPSTTRMVICTCYCILRLRLILTFSGRVFISSSVLFLSVERPVRSFTTSSVSRFQAPLGLLGFPCRNTMTTGTRVSFSSLPFG